MEKDMAVQISVIIPAYNVEKYIIKCLDSIVRQNVANIEVIVVDDGSKDKTLSICQEYAETNSCIKIISKENGGQSSARNLGIRYAVGEYLMFVDSDDFLEKNTLLKIAKVLSDEKPDVLVGNYNNYYLNSGEKIPSGYTLNLDQLNGATGEEALKALINNATYDWYPWLMIVRNEYLLQKKLFFVEDHFFEDAIWSPQIVYYAKKIIGINVRFYNYVRNRAEATTSQISKKMCEDKMNAIVHTDIFMRENHFSNDLRNVMYGNLNHIYVSLLADSWHLSKSDRESLLNAAKNYRKILLYSPPKYQTILYYMWKVCGIKGVSWLLCKRADWVRKKINKLQGDKK